MLKKERNCNSIKCLNKTITSTKRVEDKAIGTKNNGNKQKTVTNIIDTNSTI